MEESWGGAGFPGRMPFGSAALCSFCRNVCLKSWSLSSALTEGLWDRGQRGGQCLSAFLRKVMELNSHLERANRGSVIRVAVVVLLYFCLFSLSGRRWKCVCPFQWFSVSIVVRI